MKNIKIFIVSLLILVSPSAFSQSLGDILKGLGGKGNTGEILGNMLDGVFTKTNLSLSDLVGEYQSQGPAVTFKSDNLLQKAGGIAGAATIEAKLKPYYDKYGLNGMTLTIDENAEFSMKIKGLKLSGLITKNESDGTFNFNFKVVGMSLGSFTAYVEKSGSNLNLMFDATKLKGFISTVAKFTGNSMVSALGSILDSYEGACIGFKMISLSKGSSNTPAIVSPSDSTNNAPTSGNGLNILKDILNKKK